MIWAPLIAFLLSQDTRCNVRVIAAPELAVRGLDQPRLPDAGLRGHPVVGLGQ